MNLNSLNGIEGRCLDIIKRTYAVYLNRGSRRRDKLNVLHGWIKQELMDILGEEYVITSLSENPDESERPEVEGKYYTKIVNVSVSRDDKIIGIINVIFVHSNFSQNANNYFEHQMGETVNLRSNNIILGQLFCLTEPIPYYKKNHSFQKLETIKDTDIEKYNKLLEDNKHPHAPDVQGICIAKLDFPNQVVTGWADETDLDEINAENYRIIRDEMNIKKFFENFVQKTDSKYNELHCKSNWYNRLCLFFCNLFRKS